MSANLEFGHSFTHLENSKSKLSKTFRKKNDSVAIIIIMASGCINLYGFSDQDIYFVKYVKYCLDHELS